MDKMVYSAPEFEVELLREEDIVLISIVNDTYDADENALEWNPEW